MVEKDGVERNGKDRRGRSRMGQMGRVAIPFPPDLGPEVPPSPYV